MTLQEIPALKFRGGETKERSLSERVMKIAIEQQEAHNIRPSERGGGPTINKK